MIVWLWEAGSAAGVTDDPGKARRNAACVMRGTGADTAVVEGARFIDGTGALNDGYRGDGRRRWVARNERGGRIR